MMQRAIVFFLKVPAPGTVKTRLARVLGERAALRLYDAFVTDMLAMLGELAPTQAELLLCATPGDRLHECRAWLDALPHSRALPPFTLIAQEGRDLGERMRKGLTAAFERGASAAALIGSDLPDLPAERLEQAFALLETHDVALGPTADGGYYCVGMKPEPFAVEAFEEIRWSSPQVIAQTRARLAAAGRSLGLLPSWRDIDEVEDLQAFLARPDARRRAPASHQAALSCLALARS